MTENELESKDNFHNKIERFYLDIASNRIPMDLLNRLVDKITDNLYENYRQFWSQYPKSRKKYSEFKLIDLDNPFVYYVISDFFKDKDFENYKKFSMILFKMTDEEFNDYEKQKYQYETK